jgi:hypothetical protein
MPDSNSMDRAIGRLEGRIEALIQRVDQNQQSSAESRARVYNKLEGVEKIVGSIEGSVSAHESTLQEIAPLAREYGRLRERSRGFIAAIVIGWTLLGGFLMWSGNMIVSWAIAGLTG